MDILNLDPAVFELIFTGAMVIILLFILREIRKNK